jgi:hypothetical protein
VFESHFEKNLESLGVLGVEGGGGGVFSNTYFINDVDERKKPTR